MELKPCPFCGSTHVVLLPHEHYIPSSGVKLPEPVALVECFSCFAVAGFYRIKKHGQKEAREKAAEAWNRRVTDD